MNTSPGPSKISPWLYLGGLGCLSLASIFFTYENDGLPGVVSSDRTPVSSSILKQTQEDLRKALGQVSDWGRLCREPYSIFGRLSFDGGRSLSPFSRGDYHWDLPQRERDAWSRCQPSPQVSTGLRQHLCFHMKGPEEGDLVWSSSLNLLELNVELYKKGNKVALRCQDIESGSIPDELVVYYSAYWAKEKKGKHWQFERLAGGLRLPIQWQVQQASAR